MRVLSSILRKLVYPALGKVGYFRSGAAVSIVTYHGVLPNGYRTPDVFLDSALLSLKSFRSQIKLLKRAYNVISPDHFRGWLQGGLELPPRSVLLTCDDGLLNNVSVMLPVLEQEGLQCLFFVTGESLEDPPSMLWYIELYLLIRE